MKKIIVATLFSSISLSAYSAAVWEYSLKVSSVISHIGGTVEVMSLKNGVVWTPCEAVEWYKFDVTQPGGSAMKSSLLTGLATGKTISLVYDCENNSISAVKIDTQ